MRAFETQVSASKSHPFPGDWTDLGWPDQNDREGGVFDRWAWEKRAGGEIGWEVHYF